MPAILLTEDQLKLMHPVMQSIIEQFEMLPFHRQTDDIEKERTDLHAIADAIKAALGIVDEVIEIPSYLDYCDMCFDRTDPEGTAQFSALADQLFDFTHELAVQGKFTELSDWFAQFQTPASTLKSVEFVARALFRFGKCLPSYIPTMEYCINNKEYDSGDRNVAGMRDMIRQVTPHKISTDIRV